MAASNATNVMQGVVQTEDLGEIKCILTSYSDRVFLNLSTNDKMGTMMLCSKRQRPDGSPSFECETVLGKRDDDAHALLARMLTSVLCDTFGVPLLLSVAVPALDTDCAPGLAAGVKDWVAAPTGTPSST